MAQITNRRLAYIDISKVLAMFLVTWAHCAQQLCGSLFPELLISKDAFISFNMAVFMIASGYVMNIPKMRETSLVLFVYQKVVRLLIPMSTWFFIWSIVVYPKHLDYWLAYWYLSSMFVCLVTIKFLTAVFSSDMMIALSSMIILSLMPFHSFERICYMVPFLWVGYVLRHIIAHINIKITFLLSILYCFMYYFWDVQFSVYISPLHIWETNVNELLSAVFRLGIGTIGGVSVISWIRIVMKHYQGGWMNHIASYGQYTLVFYTMSFVLNSLLSRILWHFGISCTTPGILDFVSLTISFVMMILMYSFQKIMEHNRFSCLMLGIVYQKSKI